MTDLQRLENILRGSTCKQAKQVERFMPAEEQFQRRIVRILDYGHRKATSHVIEICECFLWWKNDLGQEWTWTFSSIEKAKVWWYVHARPAIMGRTEYEIEKLSRK